MVGVLRVARKIIRPRISRILLFAFIREIRGKKFIELSLPEGATVQALKAQVAREFPALAENMKSALTTVNREYAFDEAILPEGAELAMFPPVSGG
ncbi:MAG: molybdopterin synthase sulfur carrier subunit [Anaerolineae bacterium]|nr:MAG: molybdopterin synthase sulfur carrier subunit [Anaerolineae bacterium]